MTQPDKLMREALEFYANLDNWKWVAKPTDTDFILDCGSEVQRDFGEIARKALNSTKTTDICAACGKPKTGQCSQTGTGAHPT